MSDQGLQQTKRIMRSGGGILLSVGMTALVMIGSIVLFIMADGRLFGVQLASSIVYSAVMFWWLFLPTRMGPGYSLREVPVREAVTYLLRMHAFFLSLLILMLTTAFFLGPHLPAAFTQDHHHGTKSENYFELTQIMVALALGFIELYFAKRHLREQVAVYWSRVATQASSDRTATRPENMIDDAGQTN